MDKTHLSAQAGKPKANKIANQNNVVEALKDIGQGVTDSFKNDLLKGTSEDFFKQMFSSSQEPAKKTFSQDFAPGESLEFKNMFSGKSAEESKLKNQLVFERRLAQEERSLVEKRSNELRLQLQALMQEILALAKTTQNIGHDVEVAAMLAPASPGIYHLVFFEKLLGFIKSFRKKIENAHLWFASTNKRAEKKNYWATYKKKGSSFLLSPDHYLQRSAG